MSLIASMLLAAVSACSSDQAIADQTAKNDSPQKDASPQQRDIGSPATAIPSSKIVYDSISESPANMRDVSLCELAKTFTGGTGLYRVESMTGATEERVPGALGGFTYVELSRREDWSDSAPEHAVARITGGPSRPGVTTEWSVALDVGETVGVMFVPASPENRNYLGLHRLGLFKKKGNGFTNGQLFSKSPVDVATVREKLASVSNVSRGGKCIVDEVPDTVDDSQSVPTVDPNLGKGPVVLGTAPSPKPSAPTNVVPDASTTAMPSSGVVNVE